MKRYSSPEEYIEAHPQWKDQLEQLRTVLNSTGMEEKMKWGIPVYCVDNKNVVGLGAFKGFCGLWFFYGAILADSLNILEQAQEGTKHMRHWKFFEGDQVEPEKIKPYLIEAAEKVDLAPKPERSKKTVIPELLQAKLDENAELSKKFKQLTPFKQREYCEHIDSAKQEKTKISRLEKAIPMILEGKGLHDKYRR
ncbi:YdeI/OmpD-associated family protein [Luteibaculum oceani]|uniref:YdhG-like domain-containing protein n=1 Tax=Luteibaculum oceani TaxID=1294296 RepID=A0A5C6VA22_9FLAO|nr:YdeI/OmpD-associated family protein [Luteibaculum oceani]TXC82077.1 hypothetical protein FRX97_03005 [Luteibaculum oceani]